MLPVTNKKLNVFGGEWSPSPSKLGTMIENLEHVLAPLEHLGSDVWFCCKGALKIWGKSYSLNWKPHNSVTPWVNPSKFWQLTHPERTTNTANVNIRKFSKILLKFSVLGVLYPYLCTDEGKIWHGLFHAKFLPHRWTCGACGAKTLKIDLWSN